MAAASWAGTINHHPVQIMALDLEDLAVECIILTALSRAQSVREDILVNGRTPSRLTRALNDENPGKGFYRAA
ncbi:MAG: hypothetical protein P1S60_03520 [Anaerolineae bacterium]|nr:hypothetical protein [Anaerolineae bacterium]